MTCKKVISDKQNMTMFIDSSMLGKRIDFIAKMSKLVYVIFKIDSMLILNRMSGILKKKRK
jgi:hypothetical protein